MFRRTFKAILILHSIHLRVQIRLETETDLDYTEAMQYELHFVDTIDSTNNAVKALAQAGASEGFVLIADHQTAGRGRLGRSFYSPSGSGLYLSILLRPEGAIPPDSLTCLTAAAAAETALQFGVDCRIKWVNDLYRADRKVAGILTEGGLLTDGSYSYAVVGIGFNLCVPPKLPAELRDIVGGLFDEPVIEQQRHAFLKSFLSRFAAYYETLPEISFREAYCKRLNVFGRAVSFWHGGVQRTGIAEAIDPQFRLLVRSGEELVPLERGEVTFL